MRKTKNPFLAEANENAPGQADARTPTTHKINSKQSHFMSAAERSTIRRKDRRRKKVLRLRFVQPLWLNAMR